MNHIHAPEVESSLTYGGEDLAGSVYEITDAAILHQLLGNTNHGVTTGLFAFDKNATHFTISRVQETDTESGYFVNVDSDTDLQTVYTHAQENQVYDLFSNNSGMVSDEGIRAFATIDADADPVDALGEGEKIFYSLSGPDADLFTIDNLTGEIFLNYPPDYEALSPDNLDFFIDVTATDGYMTNWTLSSPYHHGTIDIDDYDGTLGLSTTENIMLHITDVNETPSMMISGIDQDDLLFLRTWN